MKTTIAIFFLGLTALACATAPPAEPVASASVSAQPDAGARLHQLFESYFEETLRLNPTFATSIGDDRYNDQFSVSIGDEHRAATRTLLEISLAAIAKIDPAQLNEKDRLSYEIFKLDLEQDLKGYRFPSHLIPVNQFGGTPSSFAQLGSGTSIHPFKKVKDYDDFLGRTDGFLKWVDTAIANMRKGMSAGVVQPRVVMEKSLPQLQAHVVDDVEKSIFYRPIQNFPADFNESDRKRLTAAYAKSIREKLVPAYRRLHDFIRDEYMSKTRTSVGRSALADGKAWYAYLAETSTTTRMTPDQIHNIGLAEVARIRGEMEKLRLSVGFKGSLAEFFKHLQTDSRFYFTSKDDLLAQYREQKRRIDASTGRLFDVQPKADYEIRPVEEFREKSASSGSYMSATPDGSRPGVFYVNTYDLSARPIYAMESLLLHEGSPGHHFQISIQQELEELPRFRRFGGYTAYVEGWGLYAESLGSELGLYADPYQKFGGLDAELWRAIRLVLDTGIHAKGWTREQALEYAKAHSPVGETRAVSEVERFIAIPGQALAYKIGQLKITELRRRAEKALGEKFDVKAFHREVLEDGSLPLDILERKIDKWIAESRS